MATRSALAALVALGCFTSACGPGGTRDLGPAATTAPPEGTRSASCRLDADQGPIMFSFTLGDDYAPDVLESGAGCLWRRTAPPRTTAPTTETSVVVEWVGDTESLSDVYDAELPFVADDGDDAISDLRLAEDVVVFGATVGDRLRWDCFCDGLPNVTYLSQAGGVRLTWNASSELQDQVEDEVRAALASAGTG